MACPKKINAVMIRLIFRRVCKASLLGSSSSFRTRERRPMMTSKNILPRTKIADFIDNLYDGDLHAKRVLSLANATLGVLVSIQDPVAEVVRSRRRTRIGAIHPGAGSVGAEAPARPGSAHSAIQLSAAAGHHGGRSAGTRIDARICDARTRIRRSVPRPHCRHTVMSIPVRRSIIASGVSGSPGVGRKHLTDGGHGVPPRDAAQFNCHSVNFPDAPEARRGRDRRRERP